MSDAPRDRHLANAVRDLAWGNFSAKTQRVMFLGPRGEVRDVLYPNQDGHASILAKRADLMKSGELSAVVYLGDSANPRSGPTQHRRVLWCRRREDDPCPHERIRHLPLVQRLCRGRGPVVEPVQTL